MNWLRKFLTKFSKPPVVLASTTVTTPVRRAYVPDVIAYMITAEHPITGEVSQFRVDHDWGTDRCLSETVGYVLMGTGWPFHCKILETITVEQYLKNAEL